VNHDRSVAVGADSESTAADQVQFGLRHVELREVTAPGTPGSNRVRLYAQDNGAGKTQLIAKFQSGATVVIATDP